jgi:hypothetical protein
MFSSENQIVLSLHADDLAVVHTIAAVPQTDDEPRRVARAAGSLRTSIFFKQRSSSPRHYHGQH